mmetsp:Transcript_21470/g.47635  ORF Transcript_21470/g.47635 Transcript_21470/m.47635 type:complete len:161 (+) Transcript_21470:78-560(+)
MASVSLSEAAVVSWLSGVSPRGASQRETSPASGPPPSKQPRRGEPPVQLGSPDSSAAAPAPSPLHEEDREDAVKAAVNRLGAKASELQALRAKTEALWCYYCAWHAAVYRVKNSPWDAQPLPKVWSEAIPEDVVDLRIPRTPMPREDDSARQLKAEDRAL